MAIKITGLFHEEELADARDRRFAEFEAELRQRGVVPQFLCVTGGVALLAIRPEGSHIALVQSTLVLGERLAAERGVVLEIGILDESARTAVTAICGQPTS